MRIRLIALLAVLGAVATLVAQSRPAALLLEEARKKIVIDGDRPGAIKLYEQVVSKYGTDRPAVAQALMGVGELYEELGDAGRARSFFDRVARDYGDQPMAGRARAWQASHPSDANGVVWTITEPAQFYGPASSDGRLLAWANYRTGDLFVRDLRSGTDKRITTDGAWGGVGGHSEGAAAFSRDGGQLAYEWLIHTGAPADVFAELRVVTLGAGQQPGTPRPLFSNREVRSVVPYGWTPDGQTIVAEVFRPDRSVQLVTVSTRTGDIKPLMSAGWQDTNAFVSPDGAFVAFDLRAAGTQVKDIYALSLDGQRRITVIEDPNHKTLVGWSPDGRQLIFTSDRDGSRALWSVPFRTDSAATAGEASRVRPNIPRFNYSLGVTSAGSLLTSVDGESIGVSNIKVGEMDFASGKLLTAPTIAAQQFVGANFNPMWSPDGKFLAWVSARQPPAGPTQYYLVTRPINGAQTSELRVDLDLDRWSVQWAPDGRSFMVLGADRNQRNGLYQVDRDTGATSVIALGGPFRSETMLRMFNQPWSADGRLFYYQRNAPDFHKGTLVERDMTSRSERELFTFAHPYGIGGPAGFLSLDGRTLYYVREIANGQQSSYNTRQRDGTVSMVAVREMAIVARNLASKSESEITRKLIDGNLGMSPSRQLLSFTSIDPATGTKSLGTIDLSNGSYKQVLAQPSSLQLYIAAWSPDSRSLIVTKGLTDRSGGPTEQWWVPLDGREPHRLAGFDGATDWTSTNPDGRHVAFYVSAQGTQPDEVRVIDNVAAAAGATR